MNLHTDFSVIRTFRPLYIREEITQDYLRNLLDRSFISLQEYLCITKNNSQRMNVAASGLMASNGRRVYAVAE